MFSCCCPDMSTWACRVKPRPSTHCLKSCCVTSPVCTSMTLWITPTPTLLLNQFRDNLYHWPSAVLALLLPSNSCVWLYGHLFCLLVNYSYRRLWMRLIKSNYETSWSGWSRIDWQLRNLKTKIKHPSHTAINMFMMFAILPAGNKCDHPLERAAEVQLPLFSAQKIFSSCSNGTPFIGNKST